MTKKILDLNKSIFDLCTEDPAIIDLLAEIGFTDITNPTIRNTAGRIMTLPKGAAMKKKNLAEIKDFFIKHGYLIKGE